MLEMTGFVNKLLVCLYFVAFSFVQHLLGILLMLEMTSFVNKLLAGFYVPKGYDVKEWETCFVYILSKPKI